MLYNKIFNGIHFRWGITNIERFGVLWCAGAWLLSASSSPTERSPPPGYVSRPSIGVELAPDSVSGALGVPGAMVMKAPAGAGGRWKEGRKEADVEVFWDVLGILKRCSGAMFVQID